LISWKLPFDHKKTDQSVILAITNGELPNKPEETGDPEVFEALWNFCGLCWLPVENSSRPSAGESLGILSGMLSHISKAKKRLPASATSNTSRSSDGLGQSRIFCSVCRTVKGRSSYETGNNVNPAGWKCRECSKRQPPSAVRRHGHESQEASGSVLDHRGFRKASTSTLWAPFGSNSTANNDSRNTNVVPGRQLEDGVRWQPHDSDHSHRDPDNVSPPELQLDTLHLVHISHPNPSRSNEYYNNIRAYQGSRQTGSGSLSQAQLPHDDTQPHSQLSGSYIHTAHYGPTTSPTGQDVYARGQLSTTSPNMVSHAPSTSSFISTSGLQSDSTSSVVCNCRSPYSGEAKNVIACRTCRRLFHMYCCRIATNYPEKWKCWECI